jgi:hypothetical protein
MSPPSQTSSPKDSSTDPSSSSSSQEEIDTDEHDDESSKRPKNSRKQDAGPNPSISANENMTPMKKEASGMDDKAKDNDESGAPNQKENAPRDEPEPTVTTSSGNEKSEYDDGAPMKKEKKSRPDTDVFHSSSKKREYGQEEADVVGALTQEDDEPGNDRDMVPSSASLTEADSINSEPLNKEDAPLQDTSNEQESNDGDSSMNNEKESEDDIYASPCTTSLEKTEHVVRSPIKKDIDPMKDNGISPSVSKLKKAEDGGGTPSENEDVPMRDAETSSSMSNMEKVEDDGGAPLQTEDEPTKDSEFPPYILNLEKAENTRGGTSKKNYDEQSTSIGEEGDDGGGAPRKDEDEPGNNVHSRASASNLERVEDGRAPMKNEEEPMSANEEEKVEHDDGVPIEKGASVEDSDVFPAKSDLNNSEGFGGTPVEKEVEPMTDADLSASVSNLEIAEDRDGRQMVVNDEATEDSGTLPSTSLRELAEDAGGVLMNKEDDLIHDADILPSTLKDVKGEPHGGLLKEEDDPMEDAETFESVSNLETVEHDDGALMKEEDEAMNYADTSSSYTSNGEESEDDAGALTKNAIDTVSSRSTSSQEESADDGLASTEEQDIDMDNADSSPCISKGGKVSASCAMQKPKDDEHIISLEPSEPIKPKVAYRVENVKNDLALSLHDCVALGEIELGLTRRTENGSAVRKNRAVEEIQCLPLLLRLLSLTRPLSTVNLLQALDSEESENEEGNDTDTLVDKLVARLEHVAATYSVAEGIDVVTCHLAPSVSRKLSKLPPLVKTSSDNWDTSVLSAVARNPVSSRSNKRRRLSVESSSSQQQQYHADDGIGDSSENDDDDDGEIDPNAESSTGGNKRRRGSALSKGESSVPGDQAAAEDSQEATFTKTLSELVSLVVSSLEPLSQQDSTAQQDEAQSSEQPPGRSSQLLLTIDDSILAESGASADEGVGGAMARSDLGSTVASIMHHAPVLRSRHVAVRVFPRAGVLPSGCDSECSFFYARDHDHVLTEAQPTG